MAEAQFAVFNASMSPRRAACARCRQQKLRCLFETGENQCSRCFRAQVSCIVNLNGRKRISQRTEIVENVLSSLEQTSSMDCSVFHPTHSIGNERFSALATPSNDGSHSSESFFSLLMLLVISNHPRSILGTTVLM